MDSDRSVVIVARGYGAELQWRSLYKHRNHWLIVCYPACGHWKLEVIELLHDDQSSVGMI